MANNGAFALSCGGGDQGVTAGYYSGGTLAGDGDLVGTNIKSSVDIFGVTGTVIESSGDAVAGDVLTGKTFSNAGAAGVSGTMANIGAFALSCGVGDQGVTAGYYSGGTLAGDADLVAGNILSGVDIFGVTGTAAVASYPALVPKTGQTSTVPINSAPTGSDGNLQRGVSWPTPRFTDNSNGTVTDNLTGLIWLKNANCANATRDWTTALSDVTQLNTDGTMNSNNCGDTSNGGSYQTDWRLPNRFEFESLLDLRYVSPSVPNTAGTGQWTEGQPFSGVLSEYYWSGSTYASSTSNAWFVSLSDGYVSYTIKAGTNYVWPVRGGQ
ncbi:MAG: DUF1566 domain-containing protein [Planctomycetes bacterium]|nr:DUF1566 domain-containing protein [Planctomycetota bacterium]